MKSFILIVFSCLSLIATVSAGSNHETVVCEGNNDVCKGGKQTGPNVAPTYAPTLSVPAKRSIMDLFRAASVKREAATIEGIAQQIKTNTLDPQLKQAAEKAGYKAPAKRELGTIEGLMERARGSTSQGSGGAKGGGISVKDAISHLESGKPLPAVISKALDEAGWAKGGKGGKGAKGAKSASKGGSSKGVGKKGGKRDGIYAREAALSHHQIHSLLHTMEDNPEAEDFVVKAINSAPGVEDFTEKLAHKWLAAREIIPLEYLEARDAEAAASRAADAYFNRLVEKRDALPEAEAVPELEFEERDAEAEADLEEIYAREAEPEADAYYFDFEERDAEAEPEAWIYEHDIEFVY
ncbi:hypothetical protein MMC13_004945 [Lambiella insularis]|nr:hypothetical protein [Lambiella insularis]